MEFIYSTHTKHGTTKLVTPQKQSAINLANIAGDYVLESYGKRPCDKRVVFSCSKGVTE